MPMQVDPKKFSSGAEKTWGWRVTWWALRSKRRQRKLTLAW